ncbi:MAG: hypothetical protein ACRDSP_12185 [Pseudonocardiaceae bacterium]
MNPTGDDPNLAEVDDPNFSEVEDLDLSEVMTQIAELTAQQAHHGRTCSVPGCNRKHYGRGLCKTHYMRQVRTGHPGPAAITTRPPREPTCTVTGCEQPHQARGLCRTHYSRWQRTGDIHPDTPRAPRRCRLPGCSRRHHRQGMCRMHFRRAQQTGSTQTAFDLAEATRLYRGGASAATLGQLYSLTPHTVLARLRAAGVQIRPPGRQPRSDPSAPTTSTAP